MAKSNHVHKFRRLKYKSGNSIFFCALPDCNQKINIALALGKRSLCWRCGEPFIMTEYSLRLAKPHCENCHKPKTPPEEIGPGIIVDKETIRESISGVSPLLNLAERLKQAKTEEEDEI